MSQSEFSITANGPQMPDSAAVLADVQSGWTGALGDTLNTNPATPQGQIMASQAAAVQDKNSQLLWLCNQFDPQQAEGQFQDALAKIYFLQRNAARPTVVPVVCGGLPGTAIAGSDSGDDPAQLRIAGSLFACTQSGVIGTEGTVTLPFAAVEPGPLEIPAQAEISIVQAVPGWDTAENPSAGVTGQSLESRAAFEARRYQSVARNARSVAGAVYARVAELDGVLDCVVRQNRGSAPIAIDGVTLAPHSMYVGVEGGQDGEIAQAIYDSLSGGCDYNGDSSVQVTDAVTGAVETVSFTRLADLRLGVQVTVRKNASLPSDATTRIQDAVLADFYGELVTSCGQQTVRVRAGDDLYASCFYTAILGTGVTQLVSIELAAPMGDAPVWVDYVHIRIDQAPQLARADIIVNVLVNELEDGRTRRA